MVDYAREKKMVRLNPVTLMTSKQKRLPKDKPAAKVWTDEQTETYLRFMRTRHLGMYVAYRAFCGTAARGGEIPQADLL